MLVEIKRVGPGMAFPENIFVGRKFWNANSGKYKKVAQISFLL